MGEQPVKSVNKEGAGLCAHLVASGLLAETDLARAEAIALAESRPPHVLLSGLGFIGEEALAMAIVEHLGLPLLSAGDFGDTPPATIEFNAAFLEKSRLLPVGEEAGAFQIAMVDPCDEDALQAVSFMVAKPISRAVITPATFEKVFARFYGDPSSAEAMDTSVASSLVETDSLQRLKDLASEAPVVRLVNRLVSDAIEARASDIHLEPEGSALRARYRIDGVLQDVDVPRLGAAAVISRLKILAQLDIAERRLPQDGRIRLAVRGREIDFRVSTVPVAEGESIVLRVLDKSQVVLDYGELGFTQEQIILLRELVARPHGIFLVTGPTGSGKTTTLYTALSELNDPARKILTIEDPVEYVLGGINQSQVNTKVGLTFASALRAFLRQDPDILMVGEIRDLETARIAVQSALTGHLVLSTLHTNDARSAITRLQDLGVEDYLIGSTVTGVMAQRLVRKLCACAEPHVPEARVLQGLDINDVPSKNFRQPKGCDACQGTGYRGRMVIAEIIDTQKSDAENASQTLLGDGILKAGQGVTSLEEILRAVTHGV